MSLFSPSLLATSDIISLIRVFLWRQGGRFLPFRGFLVHYHSLAWYFVHVFLLCLYFASSLKLINFFSNAFWHVLPWVSHCISFRCILQPLRLCRFVVVYRAGFCVQCWWGDGVCTWFGWVMQAPKKEKAAPSSKPAKSSGGGGKQKKKVCVVAGPSLEAMHSLSWCWNVLEWRD